MVALLSNGRKSRTDIDAYGRDNRKLVKLRLCVCVSRPKHAGLRMFYHKSTTEKKSGERYD
jgi:hypothetical protein